MRTAVSIPDDVFEGAERLARKSKKSRSQLYSEAVRAYVARHAPEEITEAMNRVCSESGLPADEFVSTAAGRILASSEWGYPKEDSAGLSPLRPGCSGCVVKHTRHASR